MKANPASGSESREERFTSVPARPQEFIIPFTNLSILETIETWDENDLETLARSRRDENDDENDVPADEAKANPEPETVNLEPCTIMPSRSERAKLFAQEIASMLANNRHIPRSAFVFSPSQQESWLDSITEASPMVTIDQAPQIGCTLSRLSPLTSQSHESWNEDKLSHEYITPRLFPESIVSLEIWNEHDLERLARSRDDGTFEMKCAAFTEQENQDPGNKCTGPVLANELSLNNNGRETYMAIPGNDEFISRKAQLTYIDAAMLNKVPQGDEMLEDDNTATSGIDAGIACTLQECHTRDELGHLVPLRLLIR